MDKRHFIVVDNSVPNVASVMADFSHPVEAESYVELLKEQGGIVQIVELPSKMFSTQ